VYHPNPLDPRGIGELVRRFQVTFLLSTPTFLQMYHRGCEAGDFGSLRLVLVGAEKLSDAVATAFEEKFGIRPVEAYGCTECSPGVSVSCHSYRAAGFNQVGAKRGKIGHPLPGVSVRIVDPESFQPLEIGRPGLLLVRGPNLMKGYWQKPEATQAVVREGWYITGDIATLDEDGFLQITDRLSRFSKIGGEMVPHVKVEDRLQELAGIAERGLVVTGLPDPRKGERLVVLHTLPEAKLAELLARLPESNLPNLWVPRPSAFIRIEALPHLGTGKLDLRRVRELAAQLSTAGDEPTPAEVG
jgi:acyl-[acyl-carrier-protein]-phospholipid O-acyltransferase/long-chain-fatty-acid--[acyl-carrier-protein] ligase